MFIFRNFESDLFSENTSQIVHSVAYLEIHICCPLDYIIFGPAAVQNLRNTYSDKYYFFKVRLKCLHFDIKNLFVFRNNCFICIDEHILLIFRRLNACYIKLPTLLINTDLFKLQNIRPVGNYYQNIICPSYYYCLK